MFETAAVSQPLPGQPGSELVRAYVWELPVRVTHWVTVLAVAVLAFTGYYIHDPFIEIRSTAPYTMATMRFIHILAGFVFTASFIVRIYWMFKGNHCSRWPAFIPIRRSPWRGIGEMILYYSFLRWRPAYRIGHNSLAAVVYVFMFLLMLVQILTGFAMYGEILNHSVVTSIFGWLPHLINIQYLRMIHYFVMWGFLAFAIHHVYSAVLVSMEEKNALIESIFTGYKFVPVRELEGVAPCDAETSSEAVVGTR
ncbi:MAG: Ni/Fe-hydrogenase, b-type cytochrome subunit [Acidobacteriota bacterium]